MINVGGISMEVPIILGAGVCKNPASIKEYMHPELPLGAVVTGSYTPLPRDGNGGTMYAWVDQGETSFALNSFGMPNCGYVEAYRQLAESTQTRPLIVSVAGFSPADYKEGLEHFGRDIPIELNLGCPNAHDEKVVPFANDLDSTRNLLELCSKVRNDATVWLKLSPYLTERDAMRLPSSVDVSSVPFVSDGFAAEMANLINSYAGLVSAVVVSNTVGNCVYRKNGTPVTTPNGGKAGMSGPAMKQFALRQTDQFRVWLTPAIDLIGCGGIMHGDDVVDYLHAGAVGVQCTTLPYQFGGPKVFAELISGSDKLQQLMKL